jgi:hypothetical protein
VIFTLCLYYFGPIPWEGAQSVSVLLVVAPSLLAFNLGCFLSRDSTARFSKFLVLSNLTNSRGGALSICFVFAILFAVHLQMVTGKSIVNPAAWSLSFGDVYTNYFQMVTTRAENSVYTQLLLVIKATVFPLVLLSFFRFYGESSLVVIVVLFLFLGSSILRGTDKENLDIALLLVVISYYRGTLKRLLFFGAIFVVALLILFVQRRFERYDAEYPSCLPSIAVCFDYSSTWAERFGPMFEMGRIMVASYITQGYEGLHIATGLRFDFNYGLGHLKPLQNALCALFSIGCDIPDYNDKLYFAGWNTRFHWPSSYTYLANDLTWFLVPLYFFSLGRVFALAEKAWIERRQTSALISIFLIVMFFFYSSANMQIAANMDWLFASLLFIYGPFFYSLQLPLKRRPYV